jgi:hypothetical protein
MPEEVREGGPSSWVVVEVLDVTDHALVPPHRDVRHLELGEPGEIRWRSRRSGFQGLRGRQPGGDDVRLSLLSEGDDQRRGHETFRLGSGGRK